MIQRYAQFWFFRKGSGSFPTTFYNFSRKTFLMSYSINRPDFIVWLPLLLEILGNMYIAIVCFPGCEVINFEINQDLNQLIFLIKPLFYMTKKTKQNLNTFRMKSAFKVKHFSSFLKGFQLPKVVSDLRLQL